MSKLILALGPMMGGSSYCPDCGCDMKSNGTCPECGYGEEDDMKSEGGEEDDEEEEGVDTQALLDLKDDLQRVIEKINRLIVKD